MKIKVFDYIRELDCFAVREEFRDLVERLGIAEWTPVVWICRLFALDNDFGEHMFDNWDEREEIAERAKSLGYEEDDLLILNPDRFTDHDPYCLKCRKRARKAICPDCKEELHVGIDGPCHSDEQRKLFWTDVLQCLELDLETIFNEARAKGNVEEEINLIKDEYKM